MQPGAATGQQRLARRTALLRELQAWHGRFVQLVPSRRCWRSCNPSLGIARAFGSRAEGSLNRNCPGGQAKRRRGATRQEVDDKRQQQGLAPGASRRLLRANRIPSWLMSPSPADFGTTSRHPHSQPGSEDPAEEGQPYNPAQRFRRMISTTTSQPVPTIELDGQVWESRSNFFMSNRARLGLSCAPS